MTPIPNDIIIQAASGDENAFRRIYEISSGFVYSLALRITKNNADAQEVTQEVFIKMHGKLKYFRFQSSFKTWLYRVSVNTAINMYKKVKKERSRLVDFDLAQQTFDGKIQDYPDYGEDDDSRLADRLLETLPPNLKACLILRELENLSYQEIAASLKVNINTIRTWLKRARETLLEKSKSEVIVNEMR